MPQKRLNYDPYRDYYIVLELSPKATAEEIQRAWRERAKILHPDTNKSPDATAQFQLLNEAYETLRDPETRYIYDNLRETANGFRPPHIEFPSSSGGRMSSGRREWQKWRAVFHGMMNSPSYRVVFLFIGIVIVANVTFILFSWMNQPVGGAELPNPGERPIPDVRSDERCPAGAFIFSPQNGSQTTGGFEITGTTQTSYTLDWTPANIDVSGRIQEFSWSLLTSGEKPITQGKLASLEQTTPLPTGRIRLRLTAGDQSCEITIQH